MTDRRPAAPEDAMTEGEHLLGNRMQAEPAANATASRASIWDPPSAQEPCSRLPRSRQSNEPPPARRDDDSQTPYPARHRNPEQG